jgi:hypothetical protein
MVLVHRFNRPRREANHQTERPVERPSDVEFQLPCNDRLECVDVRRDAGFA